MSPFLIQKGIHGIYGTPKYVALNVSSLVRAKIHVEVVKLASDVVKRDMAAKAAKKIQCVNTVRMTTCHPQNNVLSGNSQTEKKLTYPEAKSNVNINSIPESNMLQL